MAEMLSSCPKCGKEVYIRKLRGRNPDHPIGFQIWCDCGFKSFISKRREVLVREFNKYCDLMAVKRIQVMISKDVREGSG